MKGTVRLECDSRFEDLSPQFLSLNFILGLGYRGEILPSCTVHNRVRDCALVWVIETESRDQHRDMR